MVVLGISCNWGARRVSYAIIEGTRDNPRSIIIDDFKLSKDIQVTPLDHLVEIFNKMSDLCQTRSIRRACLITPGGWVTPRRRPGHTPAHPMKIRMETAAGLSMKLSSVHIEAKDIKRVALDLGLSLRGSLRGQIRNIVDRKLPVVNDDQRDAAAAALSILG